MEKDQNRPAEGSIDPKAEPSKDPTNTTELTTATGHAGPATDMAKDSPLWENELFAVTQEGLVVKRDGQCMIQKKDLSMVGDVIKTIPAKYSSNSLYVAIDHAVRIHFPAEFPDGLKTKRGPEGA